MANDEPAEPSKCMRGRLCWMRDTTVTEARDAMSCLTDRRAFETHEQIDIFFLFDCERFDQAIEVAVSSAIAPANQKRDDTNTTENSQFDRRSR
jgi:hypothetical protein